MEVSLQAGRVVGEHWRLRDRLGEAGASRFWEAEELRAGGHVVIEFACIDVSDPQARLRFSRETRLLMAFRSPHVVRTIHRGLAADGLAFAVTELLHGEDLGRKLARESALGLPETAQILDQICRGLSKLEAAKIEHRVVEPKHVFIADDRANAGVVKLLNIGLGGGASDSSSPYVRSERIGADSTPDVSTQVWAIGVLGYRMLTRTFPFEPDRPGTLRADWQIGIEKLHEELKGLPRELDEWFQTALQPDPTQRFATVEQAGLAFGHIASTYVANAAARGRRQMQRTTPNPPAAPSRARAAVIEWDQRAAGRDRVAKAEASAAVGPEAASGVAVVGAAEGVHDRKTVPSPLHAAAKRRRRVAALERARSLLGMAAKVPAAQITRVAPKPVVEPAPVRERARGFVITADSEPEHALALREPAAIERGGSVVSETRAADRDLTFIVRRADSFELARDRSLRAERMRWRVSAFLAVLIGLSFGFVLRSVVSMSHNRSDNGSRSTAISAARTPERALALQPTAAELELAPPIREVALSVAPPVKPLAMRVRADALSMRPGRQLSLQRAARSGAASESVPPSAASSEPTTELVATLRPEPASPASARSIAQRSLPASRPASLPAAPPPADTTPVTVYRGF